ncbi:GH39 family glycosyl hydrolase [Manganibacter manganicus]|uniref:Beta-xylosidase n=1 Tax=Manganibacter manganicus TaxID=1873176 RepID=A0A1V8RM69_9HYPH|nr:beta-xylosidase [Pseudaminobacter manganicus]OQM74301.1 beta-xylosidase [Pseudaminobacter manganicus]
MSDADFSCDLSSAATPFPHFWERVVGSDHAPMALRADWQQQLRRCHEELGFRYVRFHGLLCDEMGTLICHKDELLYSFFNIDQAFDYLVDIGMKPFVELSFMPWTFASGEATVFRYQGRVSPPKDYGAWATLIRKLAEHWVGRYGVAEVRSWFFEVWNEPNLQAFWSGTQDDYFKLYRHSVEALKGVDGALQVGGPASARNQWVGELVAFCDKNGLPLDFVSTHQYPTDVVEGTSLGDEDDATEEHLAKSRRGIMREWAEDVHRLAKGRPVYYTEWNTSSNPRDPLHDQPYAAAFDVKTVMEASGLVEAYSFWTFTDIFAENYFPSVPFHGGFGLLNLHGIAKPSYRAFELLHHLGTEQLPVRGRHETVDAWAIRDGRHLTVLMTNHTLPGKAITVEQMRIHLKNTGKPLAAAIQRIDDDHANARKLWCEMGEPTYPTAAELERLGEVSNLVTEPQPWTTEAGAISINVELPPHAVAAVTMEFAPAD